MEIVRRDVLRWGVAVAASSQFIASVPVGATDAVGGAIDAFSNGSTIVLDDVALLDVPEIAENGGAVPVSIAMQGARRIALFADGNPNPDVVVFTFGPLTPSAAKTRIRLAKSQNVIAVAEMVDGSYRKASQFVAVTVGGCS